MDESRQYDEFWGREEDESIGEGMGTVWWLDGGDGAIHSCQTKEDKLCQQTIGLCGQLAGKSDLAFEQTKKVFVAFDFTPFLLQS